MLIQNIAEQIRQQNWFVVAVEVTVVIAGLFLAFQLDRWWEQRDDRMREQEYIERLATEVETDVEAITYAVELAKVRQGFAELLIATSADPAAADDQPVHFLAAVAQAPFTFTPSLVSNTFDDLRATGNMSLIRSEEIKSALHDYYGFDEGQRQFQALNLMVEFRHFELTAGVLSDEQYLFIQDNWFVVTPDRLPELNEATVDREQVRQAVERLRKRPQALAWLQRVRGLQRELILMNGLRLKRAEALLETLQRYSADE